MRSPCNYTLELTFSGPLLSQAAGVLAFGVDTAMQRYRGVPVLNGSLVRGNIRHALTEFTELLPDSDLTNYIGHWFGSETSDNRYTPNRAEIDFDFFWKLKQPPEHLKSAVHRTRIKLEGESGKVEKGALQIIEDCFPSGGSDIVFEGKLHARFASKVEEKAFTHWLSKALDYIPAMGSFKGAGFGKLKSWELTDISTRAKNAKKHQIPAGNTRIGITLHLDRPFCLGRPRTPDSNRIVSEEIISGNVIKGVIARQFPVKLPKDLCFDELIVSHAFPVRSNSDRPSPLPLSLAIHQQQIVDMAGLTQKPESMKWDAAPVFQPDWKSANFQNAQDAWASSNQHPERYLSIRTEINREKGISEESRLFTLECIDPHGFIWRADIELCQIEESKRSAAFARLETIFQQGLTGIGKTKARAEVTIPKPFTPFKQIGEELSHWRDNRYIVTLQTPARLLSPDLKLSGVNSHTELKKQYQKYWSNQHKDIILLNYYAQQQLTGTYYHQRQHSQSPDYHPEWLTTAGSVFILQIENDQALQRLKQWNRTGLPAHQNVDSSAADWLTTPYLPEHGYGAIIINDQRQLDRLYPAKESGQEKSA